MICNLCAVQGHKSANCPKKDKCRQCGESGHFAHACPNPWGDRPLVGGNASAGSSADPPPEPAVVSSAGPSGSPGEDPSSVDSLAGLSFGPSVCSSAEGALSSVAVSSVVSVVIYSVCSMEELNVLIQINPNLYKMCGDCAVC